ncbi:MAG: ABC transporter permease [Gammaproteobacteria bacterium]|nr:FtsX-like permease family protein [Rhodocyclaceae bacterium]MBU3910207.1 ABC transporter permease [Gammaproteobacteria bacterium]MBU3988793.1 ABC transporter permease [Gammaproteobacteria bacterium]MBU4006214.1 ABC transporter permease [Gammaproteobacteria bacterium]MBU4022669.1 ABC transporter permease [Gammaproteobacteria bacterium]
MTPTDTLRFAIRAATGYPLRTFLMVLAMSIGVAAVVVLTALGDGARRYVVDEFSSLGSNLVIVLPGRSETGGFNPVNAITGTPRDLTVEDAQAITRAPAVLRTAPITIGTSEATYGGKLRDVTILGATSDYLKIRQMNLAQGRFFSDEESSGTTAVAVIGTKIQSELFGVDSAIGRVLRVGDRRFRIIGILAQSGQGLGMNADEVVILPVAAAQAMFNTNTLFRILVEARSRAAIERARTQTLEILKARHDGEEDVTVITQDAVLATFDRILGTLTYGVAGIAAISLAVAGILVMNVMLVAVAQRTGEIGLLKALGAPGATIRNAFLAEAALLSATGAFLGYALGQAGAFALRTALPALPAYPPDWAVVAALATALITGLLFGVLPARQAARLDPVQALSKR